jgi:O-acetyl-ADP-ribose deacetylase (regulator of RNase III)
MIEYTKTNFFHMDEEYILHQVNACGVMGSGIARAIRSKYPDVYKEYKQLCEQHKDNKKALLGTVQAVPSKDKVILNCFGQENYGPGLQTDYDALRSCFKIINEHAKEIGFTRVGMPKIGAGLGGGDWKIISAIIDEESKNFTSIVSEFT